ncbi:MAG: hypothetical protein KAQ68_11550 [Clostridiales bacterium]|nr:hypothetical protein [Clostridiales bacterium]
MKIFRIILVSLVLVIIASLFFFQTTNEDMMPDPTLKVMVTGMESHDYWLDLLVTDQTANHRITVPDALTDLLSKLINYSDEQGYYPAMLGGTTQQFYGRLNGIWQMENIYEHRFWGIGMPKEIKIAIINRDGTLFVSDSVKITNYHSLVEFELDGTTTTDETMMGVGSIKEVIPWTRMILNFLVRLMAIVFIKISIGNLFGFKSKQSMSVLTKTNYILQFLFSIMLLTQVFYGLQFALNIFMYASVAIFITEGFVYYIYLKEQNKTRRILNTIIANIAALTAGYFMIYLFEWISY